jgi:hypothetical protein
MSVVVREDWEDAIEETVRRPEYRRVRMPSSSGAPGRFSRRRTKTPNQMSGMHRRRRKKIQW